jgi:hypothetical protein
VPKAAAVAMTHAKPVVVDRASPMTPSSDRRA